MHAMDAIERSYLNGYEQGAKDYKEQRDLVLQENAELVGKIEHLEMKLHAAVVDIEKMIDGEAWSCELCAHRNKDCNELKECKWEWRGIDG